MFRWIASRSAAVRLERELAVLREAHAHILTDNVRLTKELADAIRAKAKADARVDRLVDARLVADGAIDGPALVQAEPFKGSPAPFGALGLTVDRRPATRRAEAEETA